MTGRQQFGNEARTQVTGGTEDDTPHRSLLGFLRLARKHAAWWVYPDSSNSASVIRDTRLASSSQG
jgi:hypothetical protein